MPSSEVNLHGVVDATQCTKVPSSVADCVHNNPVSRIDSNCCKWSDNIQAHHVDSKTCGLQYLAIQLKYLVLLFDNTEVAKCHD